MENKKPGRKSTRPDKAEFEALREKHTNKELAEHYGVSEQTILRWAREFREGQRKEEYYVYKLSGMRVSRYVATFRESQEAKDYVDYLWTTGEDALLRAGTDKYSSRIIYPDDIAENPEDYPL